jgi:5-methylcytosine-specific restriction endonuclease McrA
LRPRHEFSWEKHHVRILLWEAQEGGCLCCGKQMVGRYAQPRSGDRDTIDHVVPLGAYGRDKLGNLALMTHLCNQRKGSRWPNPGELLRLHQINIKLGWPDPDP